MSSVQALYQRLILEHSHQPHRFGALPEGSQRASRTNPFCGDAITVAVRLSQDCIEDIRFEGAGCAIAIASASLMADNLAGRTRSEGEALADRFCRFVGGQPVEGDLGDLNAFGAVAQFPVRIECARLAWQAFLAALD